MIAEPECRSCTERAQWRAALIALRRGAIALQRGAEELLAVMAAESMECMDGDDASAPIEAALDTRRNP